MNLRRCIWKAIWLCSLGTLQITVIYKDGVVIKHDPIWVRVDGRVRLKDRVKVKVTLEADPDLKDRIKLGVSPSTSVEYWDVR